MYFKYSLQDEGQIITDGKQALARFQVKTEKLVRFAHHVEFFSGVRVRLKMNGMLTKKSFEIFNEKDEVIGVIGQRNGQGRELWLQMHDQAILKQNYVFSYQRALLEKSLHIRNESGKLVAHFHRRFVWRRLRSYLFIVEDDLDKLIFEDRLFVYSMAYVAQRILK